MSQDINGSNDTSKNIFFKNGGLVERFSKNKTVVKIAAGVGGAVVIVNGIFQCVAYIKDVESGYEWCREKIGWIKEEISRRHMVGNDVAHGLAWSHYSGYHQYVLPGLEKEIEKNKWYINLSKNEQKNFPKKLYELIPRKCYIDIEGSDGNINKESEIIIKAERAGNKREIKVPIYSIMDGDTKYYCLCNCPSVLKTINNMHDIQSAGVSRSKFGILDLVWNKTLPVQPFSDDTKLVQLMRFYYASNYLLGLKIVKLPEKEAEHEDVKGKGEHEDVKGKAEQEDIKGLAELKDVKGAAEHEDVKGKARLILFNESENKPSDILLRAIKEDLKKDTSKQKKNGSLMENKLLTAEESKDQFYDFDVFVTHSERLTKTEALQATERSRDAIIRKGLQEKGMKILSEKDCLGKDWSEKLKFAATKCRWIVFVDKEGSKSTCFTSPNVVNSLKSILESRKVQTVAIVNERSNLHISDDLRWVACIQYQDNKDHLQDTLYNIVSGSEVEDLSNLYLKPGEAAIGLAWGYAVNYLTTVLPGMKDKVQLNVQQKINKDYNLINKLIIVVPKSCLTKKILAGFEKGYFSTDVSPSDGARSYQFNVYKVDLGKGKTTYFPGQYAAPATVIRDLRDANLLDDTQMEAEVVKFNSCLNDIMKILLPDKADTFELFFYDDTDKTSNLYDALKNKFTREK